MGTIHDVGFFNSEMLGAPSVGVDMGVAGRMLAIFEACLVTGFNVQPVTGISVQDGVATVTCTNANPGFREHQRVRIEGASPPELNGDWKINTLTGATFQFPTTAPNGAATGTISAKTAPLGWTKEFSATNVAVYRPKTGLRHFFRMDDTRGQGQAAFRGYEVMTASGDSGTNPFPTIAALSSGVCINKFEATTYFPRWFVVGDDRAVYLVYSASDHLGVQMSNSDYSVCGFGEIISYIPGDVGSSFVMGNSANTPSNYSWSYVYWNGSCFPGYIGNYHYSGCYLSRRYSQEIGAPSRFKISGSGLMEGWGSSAKAEERTPYPNPADLGVLFHTPIHIQEESNNCVRGELPGPYQFLHTYASARIGDTYLVNGRQIMITRAYDNNSPHSSGVGKSGVMGWDITGPWR